MSKIFVVKCVTLLCCETMATLFKPKRKNINNNRDKNDESSKKLITNKNDGHYSTFPDDNNNDNKDNDNNNNKRRNQLKFMPKIKIKAPSKTMSALSPITSAPEDNYVTSPPEYIKKNQLKIPNQSQTQTQSQLKPNENENNIPSSSTPVTPESHIKLLPNLKQLTQKTAPISPDGIYPHPCTQISNIYIL